MIGTNALAQAMVVYIIGVFAAGIGLTLFVVFGIPWLWRLVKPWLHAVTG